MSIKLTINWTKDIFKYEFSKVRNENNKYTIQSYILKNTFLGKEVKGDTVFVSGKLYLIDLAPSTDKDIVDKHPIIPEKLLL